MVSGRGGKRERGGGGGVDNLFFPLLFIKRVSLRERETEREEAEDVEEKMRERKRVKSIPGGTSQLQSCPSECADRVCLRHSGASVIHPDKPHHAAQDKMKLALLNPYHTSFTKYINIKYSYSF